MYDDHNNTLLCTLEKCSIVFSEIWLPQVLNICIENKPAIDKIVSEVINVLFLLLIYNLRFKSYLTTWFKYCLTILNKYFI